MVKKLAFGGVPGGVVPPNYVKYLSLKYLLLSKKNGTLVKFKKFIFGRVHLGGPRGGGTPKLCLFVSQISTDNKKNWHPLSRSKI